MLDLLIILFRSLCPSLAVPIACAESGSVQTDFFTPLSLLKGCEILPGTTDYDNVLKTSAASFSCFKVLNTGVEGFVTLPHELSHKIPALSVPSDTYPRVLASLNLSVHFQFPIHNNLVYLSNLIECTRQNLK